MSGARCDLRWPARLILAVALLLWSYGCWTWWPRTVDDAFIVFHYAQNLVDGVGPIYNPGERVEVVQVHVPVNAVLESIWRMSPMYSR